MSAEDFERVEQRLKQGRARKSAKGAAIGKPSAKRGRDISASERDAAARNRRAGEAAGRKKQAEDATGQRKKATPPAKGKQEPTTTGRERSKSDPTGKDIGGGR